MNKLIPNRPLRREASLAARIGATCMLALLAAPALAQMDALNLPARSPNAVTGSQFNTLAATATRDVREDTLYGEILAGNVPNFLRTLKPVTVSQYVSGVSHTVTYYVTSDYLSIGSDADYFRMPMTPILGQWLCDALDCTMPTRKMVNDIYTSSAVKLAPSTIPPSAAMTTLPVFWDHHQAVATQITNAGAPVSSFFGGLKKDVVVTPQLPTRPPPPRVAIYGWHQLNGTPIQPLSLVHEETYADYSHGIRLVKNAMLLNGSPTTVQQVLAHPTLHVLLSDEGQQTDPTYPVAAPPEVPPYSDSFPSTGRQLTSWRDRFTVPQIISFSPTSPGGDGYILRVRDASGGIDTTRLGRLTDTDYFVQSDIYCNYRPALAGDGYERVGIFARDNGNGMFEGISGGGVQGNGYALTWDSNNGRVQCLRVVNGVPTDLLSSAQYQASSGWRQFRIEVSGSQLVFKVDGAPILNATDNTHARGQFGIGYHEYFATNSNILGTYADNFQAGLLSPAVITDWRAF